MSDARILELRYERAEEPRRGPAASVVALARWSALGALGRRRGWKAKLLPIALALFALGPAIVLLGLRALLPGDIDLPEIVSFSGYQRQVGVAILLFAGVMAPDLLCPDRRDGVLALYFSTAVSPRQYLVGKIAAVVVPLLLVTLVPMLVLLAGLVLFADDPLSELWDRADVLPGILGAGVCAAVYFGVLGLAVSSLTPRRAFAAGGYLALLVASSAVSASLRASGIGEGAAVLGLSFVPIELGARMFPDAERATDLGTYAYVLAWLVVVAGSLGVLVRRYGIVRG